MRAIFSRRDPKTIEYALEHTKEEFLEHFSNTTASQEVLEKVYDEIVKDKTVSKIGARSGEATPGQPLKPIHITQDENGDLKVIDTTNIPVRKDLDDATFTKDGRAIKSTKKVKEKVEEVEEEVEQVEEKPKKASVKKEKAVKKTTPVKKEGGASKRDFIRDLIKSNPNITNKEIKQSVLEQGFASCYDSEIRACRNS